MNKFTPGPWIARKIPEYDYHYSFWVDNNMSVPLADVRWLGGPDEANAKLIAAAPDLYAALEKLYASFQHDGNGRTKGNRAKTDIIKYNEDVKIALTTARIALEKAE